MRIYVDADACPVVKIVENIAKEYGIPVTIYRGQEKEQMRMIKDLLKVLEH